MKEKMDLMKLLGNLERSTGYELIKWGETGKKIETKVTMITIADKDEESETVKGFTTTFKDFVITLMVDAKEINGIVMPGYAIKIVKGRRVNIFTHDLKVIPGKEDADVVHIVRRLNEVINESDLSSSLNYELEKMLDPNIELSKQIECLVGKIHELSNSIEAIAPE